MVYVLGVLVVAFVVLVVVGSVTGRIKIKSCCAADPRRDLRMRGAFEDEPAAVEGAADHQPIVSAD